MTIFLSDDGRLEDATIRPALPENTPEVQA